MLPTQTIPASARTPVAEYPAKTLINQRRPVTIHPVSPASVEEAPRNI